jgi:hypothetical protein
MKVSNRKLNKYRKQKPASHRSFAEKRGRLEKHIKKEIKDLTNK